jgi:hypothetical protein
MEYICVLSFFMDPTLLFSVKHNSSAGRIYKYDVVLNLGGKGKMPPGQVTHRSPTAPASLTA